MNRSGNRLIVAVLIGLGVRGLSRVLLAAEAEPGAPKAVEAAPQEPKLDLPTVVKLSIHPAKPPAAALEYPLLPRFVDQNSGNAATLYAKVIIFMVDRKEPDDFWDKVAKWSDMPLASMPRAEIRELLARYTEVFHMVRMAARRDHCDWQPPIRETNDVYGILLPEMNHLRSVQRLLELKARFEIAEGHPAEALDTIQTGYSLAKQTGDCPFLVGALVGLATAGNMEQQVEAIIQTPTCPNLYWSLTALPDPLVDLRPALSLEADSLLLAFPELRDIEHAKHSTDEWDAILVGFVRRWAQMSNFMGADLSNLGMGLVMTGRGMAMLPQAKAELIAAGRNRKEVEAMSASQLVLLHTVLVYKQARDDMFKWFNIPYWQGREGFLATDKKLGTDIRQREIIPVASLLMPALGSVRRTSVRHQRRNALLRTVEALRFYAADHDGKLPATLDDIQEVPIPLDPVSGKPFGYKFTDGTATLDAPPPAGERWDMLGARYEITIAK